jgi:hypothetical protein
MRLGDGIDQRAGLDLLRAHRVVVSIETGKTVKHCFLCGVSRAEVKHGFPVQAAFDRNVCWLKIKD